MPPETALELSEVSESNPQPSLAKSPAKPLFRFNRDNASFFGKRGANAFVASLQAKKAETLAEVPKSVLARLELVLEQIKLTREVLNDQDCAYCKECKRSGISGKDRAALMRALCGLMDQERILRGEPLPGSMRPTKSRSREVRPPVEPV